MNKFYLYFHINPETLKVFYVGIGVRRRAFEKWGRNNFWKRVVKKHGLVVDIIYENLSHQKACELEKYYINKFGRRDLNCGDLTNLTDGGEGVANVSEMTKQKVKITRSKWSDSKKKQIKDKLTFNLWSEEDKKKWTLSGRTTPEEKEKRKEKIKAIWASKTEEEMLAFKQKIRDTKLKKAWR